MRKWIIILIICSTLLYFLLSLFFPLFLILNSQISMTIAIVYKGRRNIVERRKEGGNGTSLQGDIIPPRPGPSAAFESVHSLLPPFFPPTEGGTPTRQKPARWPRIIASPHTAQPMVRSIGCSFPRCNLLWRQKSTAIGVASN